MIDPAAESPHAPKDVYHAGMREFELRVQAGRRAQQKNRPLLQGAPAAAVTERVPDEIVVGIDSLDTGEPGIDLQKRAGRYRRIAHPVL